MKPHVTALLRAGVSVVLDFPANTRGQRGWLREIVETTRVAYTLHLLDISGDACVARLPARTIAGVHQSAVTDARLHEFTSDFTEPISAMRLLHLEH